MTDKLLDCSVVTPEKEIYKGQVDAISIPAHDGEIGILFSHAPLVCKLGTGSLRVRKGIDEQRWFIDSGFAHVVDNSVIVLTQQALRPEQIDRQQVEAMLKEAREMKVTDEISACKRQHTEEAARAQLRMLSRQ